MKQGESGFTLMELLCCVAIVALLAACAVPTHRAAMQRTRRMDARLALLHLQSLQERHAFQHGRYADSVGDLGDAPGLSRSAEGFYSVSVESRDDGRGFIARATPHPGGLQERDGDCRSFAVDETGHRSASGGPDADRRCWN